MWDFVCSVNSIAKLHVENGIGDPSSNPGQGCLHFTSGYALRKGMNSSFLLPAMDK